MTELKYFKRSKGQDEEIGTRVIQIKTDNIRPNRAQPRAEFDQNSIIRLADSIRRYGILQPLTVRASDPDDIYEYELIAGERRLRAAKMLGYLTVPCVVMEVSEETSAELAMIENLLREDLNMFEQAYGFKKLMENYRLTQEEVARRLSMSQSAVANKLRLLRLSYEEQRLILESGLTERHARAALRVDRPQQRLTVLRYISDNKLNVQAAEQYIESILATRVEEQDATPASKPSVSSIDLEIFRQEKEMMDMLKNLRRRVDAWNKNGKNASMSIANDSKTVEITIRFTKEQSNT
ncbi:MAG: ParB/RepB/Spo0J family partition protein [Clostridia bacterium]|nr:ParB/RepB/Spo0J family partition protein [Clostridia bacterium]